MSDCPDERRFGEIEKKVSSMDHRLRNMEQTQTTLATVITNQDRLNIKLEAAFDRHDTTLYGEDDKPGIVAHVHNLRESYSGMKKLVATFIGAIVTAIVGGLATFFGSKP
jgi:hypothetical protein